VKRSWNPLLWGGFVIALLTLPSYFAFFIRYQNTREFPWATFLLFALAAPMLYTGMSRAFKRPDQFRGKIFGPMLALLSVGTLVLFLSAIHSGARTPNSKNAPQVGQCVPDFTLPDSEGQPVTLSALLHQPFISNDWPPARGGSAKTAGAVLIFYRGYW
jgi:hypothetical protein